MKICWFNDDRLGVVDGRKVLDVSAALSELPAITYPTANKGDHLIANLHLVRPAIERLAKTAEQLSIDEVDFSSPVRSPSKIIGTPVNYLKHVEEAAADRATFSARYKGGIEQQGAFLKANSALVGCSEGVTLRFPDRRSDHEMELGVVIGRPASRVSESEALDYIAGYSIALDMVVRGPEDRSFRKSVDSYAVLGPWLATADEIGDPGNLSFNLSVNGGVRQASNTAHMIMSIARQIAWMSQFYTLWPGDIIMTGTCEGVGQVLPGDEITCEIERVGAMTVRIH